MQAHPVAKLVVLPVAVIGSRTGLVDRSQTLQSVVRIGLVVGGRAADVAGEAISGVVVGIVDLAVGCAGPGPLLLQRAAEPIERIIVAGRARPLDFGDGVASAARADVAEDLDQAANAIVIIP